MNAKAVCQRPVTLHAKRRHRVTVSNKRLYLRGRQPELAHECEVPISIELMRLAVKPINKRPELALVRRDLAQDSSCLTRLVTRYSVQRPMPKDHLHVVRMR